MCALLGLAPSGFWLLLSSVAHSCWEVWVLRAATVLVVMNDDGGPIFMAN
jgi:hypothetical protein